MSVKFIILCSFFTANSLCAEPVQSDIRHRPPEMSVVNNQHFKPIIDIITTILNEAKLEAQWLNVP